MWLGTPTFQCCSYTAVVTLRASFSTICTLLPFLHLKIKFPSTINSNCCTSILLYLLFYLEQSIFLTFNLINFVEMEKEETGSSDTETVVNFALSERDLSDSESIGSASTFIRRATARSSLRSEYSTLDLSE